MTVACDLEGHLDPVDGFVVAGTTLAGEGLRVEARLDRTVMAVDSEVVAEVGTVARRDVADVCRVLGIVDAATLGPFLLHAQDMVEEEIGLFVGTEVGKRRAVTISARDGRVRVTKGDAAVFDGAADTSLSGTELLREACEVAHVRAHARPRDRG